MFIKAALSLGLIVLLCGCSGAYAGASGSGGGGGSADGGANGGGSGDAGLVDGGLPLNFACMVLNRKRCEYLIACGLVGSGDPASRDCLAYFAATSCGPTKWLPRVEAPVSTLRYDGVAAQLCADGWASRACTDFNTEPPACKTFLIPNAYTQQGCYDPPSGLTGYNECAQGVCRGSSCPRTCQPKGLLNEVCRENSDCSGSLYCRLTNVTSGVGACTRLGVTGSLCDGTQLCAAGLLCSGGSCAAPPDAGQPCLGSSCDSTSWCQSGPDGGVCAPRKPLDAGCTDDVQCQSTLCEVLVSYCVPTVLSQVGAPCGLRQSCPGSTVCVGATAISLGTCLAPLDAGTPCKSSNDCQSNLACIGLDGGLALGCGPRQPPGGRCAEDRDCQLLSVCRQTSCVRLPSTGESCGLTQRCLFGPCVSTTDAGSVCSEPFGPLATCARDSDCNSGKCVTGKCLPSCTP